jgi:hypothetical protein
MDDKLSIGTVGMLLQKKLAMANHFTELIGALGAGATRIPAEVEKKNKRPFSPIGFWEMFPDPLEKIVLVIGSATQL